MLLILGLAQSANATTPDIVVKAWYMSLPVKMNILLPQWQGGTGPNEPSPNVPDVTIYLVGHINATPRTQVERLIPTPNGDMILPAHDDVTQRYVPEAVPSDAYGFFVVRGPNGTTNNVRTRAQPANSVVGAPLAYEIKIGTTWVKLDSNISIEYGLQAGLLSLISFSAGGNGLNWTTWDN